MCLLGKRGKLQFGGRERHITGMNILLSMSSVFAMFRSTTTNILEAQMDVLTALYSSWSVGYGQIVAAGNIKAICSTPHSTIKLGISQVGFLTTHNEKSVTAVLLQH